MKASNSQIRAIWGMSKKASMDEEILRDLCEGVTGTRRISKLTIKQANALISALNKSLPKRSSHSPSGKLSAAQKAKIFKLMYLLGWNYYQLRGFIKKNTGVDHINWLTQKHAFNIIEGLKKIHQRKNEVKSDVVEV